MKKQEITQKELMYNSKIYRERSESEYKYLTLTLSILIVGMLLLTIKTIIVDGGIYIFLFGCLSMSLIILTILMFKERKKMRVYMEKKPEDRNTILCFVCHDYMIRDNDTFSCKCGVKIHDNNGNFTDLVDSNHKLIFKPNENTQRDLMIKYIGSIILASLSFISLSYFILSGLLSFLDALLSLFSFLGLFIATVLWGIYAMKTKDEMLGETITIE